MHHLLRNHHPPTSQTIPLDDSHLGHVVGICIVGHSRSVARCPRINSVLTFVTLLLIATELRIPSLSWSSSFHLLHYGHKKSSTIEICITGIEYRTPNHCQQSVMQHCKDVHVPDGLRNCGVILAHQIPPGICHTRQGVFWFRDGNVQLEDLQFLRC